MERGKKAPIDPTIEALKAASHDEPTAVAFMENRRWKGTPTCPYCAGADVYAMLKRGTGERNADFRWRCRKCNQMFTVRTGTVMEESRLPVRVWCFAFWKACASKKGVSALQISRECQISYKSALFLMHRVRFAMDNDPAPKIGPLVGDVEVDETYVGGKPRYKHVKGTPRKEKVPVLAMVERGGRVVIRRPRMAFAVSIQREMKAFIDPAHSRLLTDESSLYRTVGKPFAGGHEAVNHTMKEYARGDVHSNTVESVFAILKRGIYGTFHSISKEHTARYLSEFQFRYNSRGMKDGERTETAIQASVGRRLRYKDYVIRKGK